MVRVVNALDIIIIILLEISQTAKVVNYVTYIWGLVLNSQTLSGSWLGLACELNLLLRLSKAMAYRTGPYTNFLGGEFVFNPRKIQQFSEVASVACCIGVSFVLYVPISGGRA